MGIFKYLLVCILFVIGCTTNRKIIQDSRCQFIYASKWETNFLQRDSGSGVVLEFTREGNIEGLRDVNLFFLAYPLDTIVMKIEVDDVLQSLPEGGFADVTYIHYKIRNDSINLYVQVDSTNKIFLDVPPNTYFLGTHSYDDISPSGIKDIIVKQNHWSVLKLTIYEPQLILY